MWWQQVEQAGIDRFVLVGHSYGGMVITGVATNLGARIDALVYLDAFVPEDGDALWDLASDFERKHYIDAQRDAHQDWSRPCRSFKTRSVNATRC
ncbi:MAG: alpha/beta hydrolase [Gammaproteobacteria bacterium]|nr:alpha/beta hydrolase [Gammaproteobacteria bacterium]